MAPSLLMNSKGALFWTTHLRASFNLLTRCSFGIITRDTKTEVIIYINTQDFKMSESPLMVLLLRSNYISKQVNLFLPVILQQLIDLFVLYFQAPLRCLYCSCGLSEITRFRRKIKRHVSFLVKCLSYLNDLKLLCNIDIK